MIAAQKAVHESVDRSQKIDAQLRQIHDHIATAADAAAEQAMASGGIRSSVAAAREQAVAVDASMSQISGAIAELAGTAETSREVSHQMRQLEERLGQPLLIRRPRGVSLTLEGQRLLDQVGPHLDAINEAFQPYAARAEHVLTISAVPSAVGVTPLAKYSPSATVVRVPSGARRCSAPRPRASRIAPR